ncbi:MAG: hypothetical protein V7L23_13340 [Nostoc sp.]|uniref:hypothetical protein n=1 Tax=Nostoc sp. TaxID=1180 RepID=UPI002FF24808
MDSRITEEAKLGDAQAIATLINSSLKGKRIIAKVAKKDDCLQIVLESPEMPSQESLVGAIRFNLMSLAPESINHVKIYARPSNGSPVFWPEKGKRAWLGILGLNFPIWWMHCLCRRLPLDLPAS